MLLLCDIFDSFCELEKGTEVYYSHFCFVLQKKGVGPLSTSTELCCKNFFVTTNGNISRLLIFRLCRRTIGRNRHGK